MRESTLGRGAVTAPGPGFADAVLLRPDAGPRQDVSTPSGLANAELAWRGLRAPRGGDACQFERGSQPVLVPGQDAALKTMADEVRHRSYALGKAVGISANG
jgi:hypothetical protein